MKINNMVYRHLDKLVRDLENEFPDMDNGEVRGCMIQMLESAIRERITLEKSRAAQYD